MVDSTKMAAYLVVMFLAVSTVSSLSKQRMLDHLFGHSRSDRPIIVMLTNIKSHQLKDLLMPKHRTYSEPSPRVPEIMMIRPKTDKMKRPSGSWPYYNEPRSPYAYKSQMRPEMDSYLGQKKPTKSPILKQLLRLSNNAQCKAKNQCQNTCNNADSSESQDECSQKCEIKYDCKEETDDSCALGECYNSKECNDDTCQPSTKGVLLEANQNHCTRC